MNDLELLRRYARDGCADAFEALVRRHLGWVYSASLRQVGDPALAEDVAQSVFVLLARRAATISDKVALTGWLFHTIRFAAKEARRKEGRRRKHEARAAVTPDARSRGGDDLADEAWREMAPLLDDAVASLRESDRQAVMLRFFEGREFAAVGEALGVTEAAARKRVSRAVRRLRAYFAARGVKVTGGTLVAVLLARTAGAAPAATAQAVTAAATGAAEALRPVVMVLVRGAAAGITRAKRRLAAAILACAVIIGLGALVVVSTDAPPDGPVELLPPVIGGAALPLPAGLPPADPLTDGADFSDRRVVTVRPTDWELRPARPDRDPITPPVMEAYWWLRSWLDPLAGGGGGARANGGGTPGAEGGNPANPNRPGGDPNHPEQVETYAEIGGGGGGGGAAGRAGAAAFRGARGDGRAAPSEAAATVTRVVVASAGSATSGAASSAAVPSIVRGQFTLAPYLTLSSSNSWSVVLDRKFIHLLPHASAAEQLHVMDVTATAFFYLSDDVMGVCVNQNGREWVWLTDMEDPSVRLTEPVMLGDDDQWQDVIKAQYAALYGDPLNAGIAANVTGTSPRVMRSWRDVQPVPEPAAGALALGLGIALTRRGRRRRDGEFSVEHRASRCPTPGSELKATTRIPPPSQQA